jgi:hypothetical protein
MFAPPKTTNVEKEIQADILLEAVDFTQQVEKVEMAAASI